MKFEKEIKKAINDQKQLEFIFNDIYHTYSHLIYFIISGYVKNELDIEELVDDVFMNFYQKMKTKEISNVKYYLTTSAKNTAINFINSKDFKNKFILDDDYIFSRLIPSTSNRLFEDYIEEMKEYLTDQEIEIILQHAVYDVTFKELGKKFNLKTSSVASKYIRAISKFKKHKKGNN